MQFDEKFLIHSLSNVFIKQYFFPKEVSVSIDSRTLQVGDIFIPLNGKCVDGHMFLEDALKKGAAGIFIEQHKADILSAIDKALLKEKLIVIVPSTFDALLQLAFAWRSAYQGKVVGITGSVGKTSTKEALSHLLTSANIENIASINNQNTLLGSAINIMRIRPQHKVAIFEMGISHRGEMAQIANIVRPTIGIITNIGHQHMEGLGSLSDIAIEKRDIFKFFKEDNIGIINGDQSILSDVSYLHPVIKFGAKMSNQIQARKVRVVGAQINFIIKLYNKKYTLNIKKPHAGIVFQTLAVAAAAQLLGVADEVIIKGIQSVVTVEGRFQEMSCKFGGGVLINDCYNANPESMKAALMAFEQLEGTGKKIAVLGDMLGLGINSPFWHRQIGRFLRKVPSIKKVILVGKMVCWIQKTAPFSVEVIQVPDWKMAVDILNQEMLSAPFVLVKGSRDVGLSNLVEQFGSKN
ncbi:UDP-N-acetylmuramoyl-tripeptide--D-alanyl-D-alanine ligase [bacterium]|nr:MAG: UDP-N-acetylmuramoyl-tripeptide--D-alanyl-D-alanine ligase [bacterium]